MSNKNRNIAEEILRKLQTAYSVESIPQLAKRLGFNDKAVYKWIERGKIPVENVSKKNPRLNRRFLMTGQGDVFADAERSGMINDQNVQFSIEELLIEERSRRGISDIPDTELGRALQDALDDLVSVALKLRRLIEMEKKKMNSD